jgi:hypothetical protein
MVDYAKLIDEEKTRKDSPLASAEAQRLRDLDLLAYFRRIEIDLGEETAKANIELEKRGDPKIEGPYRPAKGEDRIEFALGARKPCCRIVLQSTSAKVGMSRIHVELLDEAGALIGQADYVIEGEGFALTTYKSVVEGFPDRSAQLGSAEIAQEVIPGILRGRFA